MEAPLKTTRGRWRTRRRAIAPPWPTCTTGDGVALSRLGRDDEAAADYSRAIDNDPADPVLYRNRAAALLRAGDDEAAEADVRKAEELQGRRRRIPSREVQTAVYTALAHSNCS